MTIITGEHDGPGPAGRPRARASTPTAAIELSELTKVYPGGHRALDGVSLAVGSGEVFGFLGPNGSGKTTAVRVLVTLLRPTSGRASVAGFDVARRPQEARCLIGYAGQSTGVDDDLTVTENLALQGVLHGAGNRGPLCSSPPSTWRRRTGPATASGSSTVATWSAWAGLGR
ncbi:MAG TPA: ATP-binding cassette domain-containing protein [Acidimicrobiales bacterium]|nr:ATP-binding cassette domain-containing protein [Acidimicrobiales bacterium]